MQRGERCFPSLTNTSCCFLLQHQDVSPGTSRVRSCSYCSSYTCVCEAGREEEEHKYVAKEESWTKSNKCRKQDLYFCIIFKLDIMINVNYPQWFKITQNHRYSGGGNRHHILGFIGHICTNSLFFGFPYLISEKMTHNMKSSAQEWAVSSFALFFVFKILKDFLLKYV